MHFLNISGSWRNAIILVFSAYTSLALGSVPGIPANVSATAPLETQVALTWTASIGATSYKVYRSTTAGTEIVVQSSVLGNTYEDISLADGQIYYYKVTAVNASGESGKSSEVSVTTEPPSPGGFGATAEDSQVVLKWSASATATSYRIYRDTLGGAGGAANFSATGTTFTDTGLVNGTTYYYSIAAVNGSGEDHATGTTLSATPTAGNASEAPAGAPANFAARAGKNEAILTWLPVSNATTYDLFRGTTTGLEALYHSGLSSTTFTDHGLTNGTTYFYKVRASNAGQSSALSSEASATPQVSGAPSNLTITPGNSQIVLNWTSTGGSYAVYRGLSSGGETLLNSGLTGNTFTDAGVANGVSYFYKIQSFNVGGSSPLSTEVSAQPLGLVPVSWSGTVNFSLPGEPVQSCTATIANINRPVLAAFFGVEGTNMQAAATKYNAIAFSMDGFTPYNFGTPTHPINQSTTDDSHTVSIIDYRWPQLSAQRIQAALNAAFQLVPTHPEIQNTGLVLYGFSEGVDNMNLAVAQSSLVNRVLAVVNLSEIDEDRYNPLATIDSAPHLFLASGLSDEYSSLNLGLEDFSAVTHDVFARGLTTNQGAPLTVLDNAGVGHGGNPDHPFIDVWLDAVLSQRLPAALPVSSPVSLPSWKNNSSWVGTYSVSSTTNSPWGSSGSPGVQLTSNVVKSKSSYSDSRAFTWMPSQNTANSWLTYANSGNLSAFSPVITSPTSVRANASMVFTYQIVANNCPTSFGAASLPSTLTINTTTGVISGTTGTAGTSTITVSAANATGTTNVVVTLTVGG